MSSRASKSGKRAYAFPIFKRQLEELKDYRRYRINLNEKLKEVGLFSKKGHSCYGAWCDEISEMLLKHTYETPNFHEDLANNKAHFTHALLETHASLIGHYKEYYDKISSLDSGDSDTTDIVNKHLYKRDEIRDFFEDYKDNFDTRIEKEFIVPPDFLKTLKAEELQARRYDTRLKNAHANIVKAIEDNKQHTIKKEKEARLNKAKLWLEMGNYISVIVPGLVVLGLIVLGIFGFSKSKSNSKSSSTEQHVSDSTFQKSDSASSKKSSPSTFIYRSSLKIQRFAKMSIHYALVGILDSYHHLIQTLYIAH